MVPGQPTRPYAVSGGDGQREELAVPYPFRQVSRPFWVGLLALVTLLALFRRGRVPGRSPLLVLAGTVMMAMSLDLLTAGAVCVGLALYPMRRGLGS